MSLGESVVDNIDVGSVLTEEGALLLGADTDQGDLLGLGSLGNVLREHILGSVDIPTEVEVVDLLGVSAIAVTASDQIEQLLTGWHDVEVLHHTEELLGSDVLRLGAVEVLEAWLEEDAVGNDVTVESVHVVNHQVFFVIVENLFKI